MVNVAATPVEMSHSYVFYIDLWGLVPHNEIKVYVERDKTLVVRYGASYNKEAHSMKFDLPHNANVDSTSAVFHMGYYSSLLTSLIDQAQRSWSR
ncbi:hypothetical protein MKW98_006198 [Papaver atlanticum]|uniref:SHSP domain-containing protein n=1 Tax=Papaver atlanticum TaxID=357466 RepID=A0AAD4XXD0_9MAGN|nr:hypothetical protein MKW98_006198 [Papaver atlanticum]